MALFVALGFILSFIEIPLMPYLKYDPANVTALLAGLAYGPVSGCLVGGVTAVLHACVTGNWPGALVNIVVACAFVLPAAIVYRHSKRVAWQVFGLVLSCIAMLACAVAMNLLVYPFLGTPVEAVVAMIVPLLIPFNRIKGVINAVLAFVLQKSLRKFLVV
jgi:riboflavin transporter FmnP